jgi:hypothetical protein
VAKKAIGNMEEAIKQLKAEQAAKAATAAAAKTASAKAAAAAAPKPAPPAATPAPQPAATPTTASTSAPAAKSAATLPVKAGSQALDIYKYDSGNFGKFYDDAQKLGLTKQEAQDFFFNWIKTKNNNMAISSRDMPAFVKDFNKAAGLSTPAAKPAATAAPAPKAANPATKPAQATSTYTNWDTKDLVKFQNSFMSDPVKYKKAIDEIQLELDARGYQKPTIPKIPYAKPGTKDNRQELNEGQYQAWGSFFKPFTTKSLGDYKQTGSAYFPKAFTPGTLEHKQNQIIKKAHSTSEPWGLIKSSTTKAELPQVASVQKAVDNLGLGRVKDGVKDIRNFTGTDYTKIRAAQRGQVPRDYDYMSDKNKQKMIDEYKKTADNIEAVLGYMQKPQVPKMRGVAADDTKLANLVHLAKTGGSMKELSMNSWSTNSRTPQNFAQDGVDSGYGKNHVIFRTLNKKGASIKEMSGIQSEDEILTPANTSYRFSGYNTVVGDKGRTYHVFDMVEY